MRPVPGSRMLPMPTLRCWSCDNHEATADIAADRASAERGGRPGRSHADDPSDEVRPREPRPRCLVAASEPDRAQRRAAALISAASYRTRRAPRSSGIRTTNGWADVLGELDVSRLQPQGLGVGVHPAGRTAERRSPAGRRAVGFGGRGPATALRASTGCAARRLSDEEPAELVRTRRVDMNAVPDHLGPCDLTWSSPRAGTPRQS